MTPQQAQYLRTAALEYEAIAQSDPDLKSKAAFCPRLEELDEANQIAIWGPDWRQEMKNGSCSLCQAAVITRPIFAECVLVCTRCAPGFIDNMKKLAQA